MMDSTEEILKRLQHRGYTVVQPGVVSTEWLQKHDVLCCRGDMFWYLVKNSRESRVVVKRWEKDRDSRSNS